MDFIIEAPETGHITLLIFGILVGAIALTAITMFIIYSFKGYITTFGIVVCTIGAISCMISPPLISSYFIPITPETYNVEKFQTWALDEYLLELNDDQAEKLLANTIDSTNETDPIPVYVETYDGDDALVYLFHEEDEWRLVITESVAVSSR